MFSDSNLGKSIYAVQIATRIAETKKVLYFDFELSDKQFQLRYTDEQGNLNVFPDSLYRVEINRDSLDISNFEDAIIGNIEQAAIQTGARVLIIDNLTYLCIASEKGGRGRDFDVPVNGIKENTVYQCSSLPIPLKGAYQILSRKTTLPGVRSYTISSIACLPSARAQKITVYGISNSLK